MANHMTTLDFSFKTWWVTRTDYNNKGALRKKNSRILAWEPDQSESSWFIGLADGSGYLPIQTDFPSAWKVPGQSHLFILYRVGLMTWLYRGAQFHQRPRWCFTLVCAYWQRPLDMENELRGSRLILIFQMIWRCQASRIHQRILN